MRHDAVNRAEHTRAGCVRLLVIAEREQVVIGQGRQQIDDLLDLQSFPSGTAIRMFGTVLQL